MIEANFQPENGSIFIGKKIIDSSYSYFKFQKYFKNKFNTIYGLEENGKYCLKDTINIFNDEFRFCLKFTSGKIDCIFLISTKEFSSEGYLDLREANNELIYLEAILNGALKLHPQRNNDGCTWAYPWGAISTIYQRQDASVITQIDWNRKESFQT